MLDVDNDVRFVRDYTLRPLMFQGIPNTYDNPLCIIIFTSIVLLFLFFARVNIYVQKYFHTQESNLYVLLFNFSRLYG